MPENPDTRDGGLQQIEASSVEDAKQPALALETVNRGSYLRHLFVEAPTADLLCRR